MWQSWTLALRAVAEHAPWGNLFCFLCFVFHFIELARIFALTLSRGNNATGKTGKWETEKRESGCGRRAEVGVEEM